MLAAVSVALLLPDMFEAIADTEVVGSVQARDDDRQFGRCCVCMLFERQLCCVWVTALFFECWLFWSHVHLYILRGRFSCSLPITVTVTHMSAAVSKHVLTTGSTW